MILLGPGVCPPSVSDSLTSSTCIICIHSTFRFIVSNPTDFRQKQWRSPRNSKKYLSLSDSLKFLLERSQKGFYPAHTDSGLPRNQIILRRALRFLYWESEMPISSEIDLIERWSIWRCNCRNGRLWNSWNWDLKKLTQDIDGRWLKIVKTSLIRQDIDK